LLRSHSEDATDIPKAELPLSKDIVSAYVDFYKYLFVHTRKFVSDKHVNGDLLWDLSKNNIKLVSSHPNGWGGAQQSVMRRATVLAGLIPDTPKGHQCVKFITEGKANFHFCISNGLFADVIKVNYILMLHPLTHLCSYLARELNGPMRVQARC